MTYGRQNMTSEARFLQTWLRSSVDAPSRSECSSQRSRPSHSFARQEDDRVAMSLPPVRSRWSLDFHSCFLPALVQRMTKRKRVSSPTVYCSDLKKIFARHCMKGIGNC